MKNCQRCGALPCNQKIKPRRIMDFSKYELIEDMHPSDGNLCHNCGTAFYCVKLEHEDGFIVSNFEGELMPNYCPKCGKKLV